MLEIEDTAASIKKPFDGPDKWVAEKSSGTLADGLSSALLALGVLSAGVLLAGVEDTVPVRVSFIVLWT